MKNKIILGLVLLCVMACTVLVFHLIFDEHTKLFYINVITTCFAEVILLANIPLLSSEKLLTFKNAASSTILDVYAVVLFLWTVVYSAFIEDESGYKTLYIGMLIISVIFIIALGVVELGGNFMQKEEESLQQTAASKKVYLLSLNNYFLDIQEILSPFSSDWKDDVLRTLKVTLDKIYTIPSEKLERSEMVVSEMNQRMKEIKGLFSSLPDNADDTQRSQITRKIDLFKNYITTIKSSL
jgi:hypothetical protein